MMNDVDIQKLSEDAEIKMPAGKYKDQSIEDVPNGYLEWIVEKLDEEKSERMISEIQKELGYRKKFDVFIGG